MSHGINKVILIGNLGQNPDVRFLPSGDPVANLSIATSETWNDKNTGEKQERTEWHKVVLFGKVAEVAQKYLTKGAQVYIEGQLRTRKWQDKEGQDRYTTEVVVSGMSGQMQMLGGKIQGDDQRNSGQQSGGNGQQGSRQQQSKAQAAPDGGMPFDDSIPF